MPLTTVIIPMKNAERYVREAVESVLKQAGVELEVVVVDDGSTDGSADVVRAIGDGRVRIVPGPRRGIAAAFNAGLAAAGGAFVARCDADDVFPPGRLAWQAEFLAKQPDFGAVSGSFTMMTQKGKLLAERKSYGGGMDVTGELRRGQGRSHMSAYLFRTALVRQVGGCRPFFVMGEDVDLQLRLSEITRIWYEPRSAYLYRLHDSSITHVQKAAERSFFEGCAMEFQKQRQSRADHKDDLDLGRPPAMPTTLANSAPLTVKQQIQKLLLGQAWAAHGAGHKGEGLSLALRAWMTDPLRLTTLKSVVALAVKSPASPSPGTPGEGRVRVRRG
jgi:glycosyltransferase involved in cell wall biosynthesis